MRALLGIGKLGDLRDGMEKFRGGFFGIFRIYRLDLLGIW